MQLIDGAEWFLFIIICISIFLIFIYLCNDFFYYSGKQGIIIHSLLFYGSYFQYLFIFEN